jgi:asparagine synthase (glutamine-hydrolysing)
MCGIAGYYSKTGAPVGNTETVLKMLDLQKHRGPNDSGIRAF